LFHGEEVGVIDFVTSRYSYYLSEIVKTLWMAFATSGGSWNPELFLKSPEHRVFLKGYQRIRPLPKHFEAYCEISKHYYNLAYEEQ